MTWRMLVQAIEAKLRFQSGSFSKEQRVHVASRHGIQWQLLTNTKEAVQKQ
jgi:hypothetical protein